MCIRDRSEDDLKQWDEKAKQGILRNDSVVNNLLFGMRTSLFDAVGDTGLSAHDLGISTIAYSQEKYGGQLEFDEDKFREIDVYKRQILCRLWFPRCSIPRGLREIIY